jgi:hypothetical protein
MAGWPSGLKERALRVFQERTGLNVVKAQGEGGRDFYRSADGLGRAVLTYSKPHGEDLYWFGYYHQWRDFLRGGANSYLVLACDEEAILAIPASRLEPALGRLGHTDRGSRGHWHLRVEREWNGRFVLQRAGLRLDEFVIWRASEGS